MQCLGLKNIEGKIEILSTRNLLCQKVAVSGGKLQLFVPSTFLPTTLECVFCILCLFATTAMHVHMKVILTF